MRRDRVATCILPHRCDTRTGRLGGVFQHVCFHLWQFLHNNFDGKGAVFAVLVVVMVVAARGISSKVEDSGHGFRHECQGENELSPVTASYLFVHVSR
jgi:hypothetical protein